MTIWVRSRRSNKYLEDLSPDIPRDGFLGKVVETKVVGDDKIDHFMVLLDSQEHLGQVQMLQQVPGGPEPGHPQGLIFWKSCWLW